MVANCNLLPPLEESDDARTNAATARTSVSEGLDKTEGGVFDTDRFRMKVMSLYGATPTGGRIRVLLPSRKEWFFLLWGKLKQGLDVGGHQEDALTILHSIVPVISTCSFGCSRTLGTLNIRGLSKEAFDMLLAKSVGVLALRAPPAGTTAAEAVACGTPVIATRKNIGPELQQIPLIRLYKRVADWNAVSKLLKLAKQRPPSSPPFMSSSSPFASNTSDPSQNYYQTRAKLIADILRPFKNMKIKDTKMDFIVYALRILQHFGFNFSLPYWEQPHAPQTESALHEIYGTPMNPHLFPESSFDDDMSTTSSDGGSSSPRKSPTTTTTATHSLLPIRYSALGYQAHIRFLFGIDDTCRVVNENAPIFKNVIPNVFNSKWESDTYGNVLNHQFGRGQTFQSASPAPQTDVLPANVSVALRAKLLAQSTKWTTCRQQ